MKTELYNFLGRKITYKPYIEDEKTKKKELKTVKFEGKRSNFWDKKVGE